MYKYQDIPGSTVITYRLTRELYYGIEAEMKVAGETVCRNSVKNIFRFRKKAEDFIRLLAKSGIEPCHLEDVISDRLEK